MTSIPASRSARAMTLAPRSCPSRPALATMTRSGRSVGITGAVSRPKPRSPGKLERHDRAAGRRRVLVAGVEADAASARADLRHEPPVLPRRQRSAVGQEAYAAAAFCDPRNLPSRVPRSRIEPADQAAHDPGLVRTSQLRL